MVSCYPALSFYAILTFCRKLNTSPSTVEDKDILKLHLVTPPVKKIDLHFPLGLEVTARNMKGVTVKDALDAIYKQFKKKVPLLSSKSRGQRKLTEITSRRMTNWTSPTSLVSSGTRRKAGLASLFTRLRMAHLPPPAKSPRRRPRKKHRMVAYLLHDPPRSSRRCLSFLLSNQRLS
jgi:hypothetical protein